MGRYPLVYRQNGRAIAALVFLWPGWLATIASTIIMWMSLAHNDRVGPFSTHAQQDRSKEIELSDNHDDSIDASAPAPQLGAVEGEHDKSEGGYVGGPAAGIAGQSVPQAPEAAHTPAA